MTESFDRELELTKLQIAAEDCHTEIGISDPMYFSTFIAVVIVLISGMMQRQMDSFLFWALFGFLLAIWAIGFRGRIRYADGIRKLNAYVADFKAGKPLPSVTEMCGVREKARLYEKIVGWRIS